MKQGASTADERGSHHTWDTLPHLLTVTEADD